VSEANSAGRGALLLRLSNTALRFVTLACRLLLILMLARFLPPADVGLFGLFFISVNFGLTLAGLNFHSYSNREMVSADQPGRSQILVNQLSLYLFFYILMLPLSVVVFTAGLLPWNLFGLFLAILVIEHLTYEGYRLLVVLGRPITAGLVAFIRSASWVLVIPPLFLWREEAQSLHTVLVLWLVGGVSSLVFTGAILHRAGYSVLRASIDTGWIVRGLQVAFPFFVGTLAIRGIFTVDRFFIEAMADLAVVGVYTFYAGMCVALLGLIEAAIFNFTYPKLIRAAQAVDETEFNAGLRRLALHCSVATSSLAVVIYLLSIPILHLLDRPIYLEYLDVFALLLGAYVLFIIGMVAHYGLYALNADGAILRSRLIALFGFLFSMLIFLALKVGLLAVPTSMIVAFTLMLLCKARYLSLKRKEFFVAKMKASNT